MRILLFIVFVLLDVTLYSQVFYQSKLFSKEVPNTPWISDFAYCSDGSYYVLINYEDSMYTSDGNRYYMPYDITYSGTLLLKYSPQNELIWDKNMRGSLQGYLELDSEENLIMSGRVVFPLIFDGDTLTATNLSDGISTLKFSPNGNLEWSKSVDCNMYEWCMGVKVDRFGAVYNLIEAMYSIDCDPSEQEYILSGASNFTVLQKLDSHGNFIWAKTLTNISATNQPLSLDILDNILYIRGRTQGAADFDPDSTEQFILDPILNEEFLWKLSLDGSFVGAELFPWWSISSSWPAIVKVRSNGQEFLLENSKSLGKRSSNGGIEFIVTQSNVGPFRINDFDIGSNGDIYLVGYYNEAVTLTVNGVEQTFFDFSWNNSNGMLLTVNDLGEIKSAKPFFGNVSLLRKVKFLGNESIALVGYYIGDICFDDFENECYSSVFSSHFLNRYGLSTCSNADCDLLIFPNPATGTVSVQSTYPFYNSSLFLVDVSGKIVSSFEGISGDDFQFDVSTLSEGIYFLAYDSADGIKTKKIVKQ